MYPVDALSDALRSLRISGSMFIDADLKAPWAVVTPSSRDIACALGNEHDHVIPYHLVTEGECLVTVEGAATPLAAGDMALFPQGHVHVLGSHENVAPLPLRKEFVEAVLARRSVLPIRHGGDGRTVKLLCGFFTLERWGAEHLTMGLPALITARIGTRGGQELLAAVARGSIDAKLAGGPGSDALVCKLSEILFIEALRQFVSQGFVPARGWLAGLRDPAIRHALALLHSLPQQDWDIQSLAATCAFSRSKFAAAFTRLVGSSPMKYLAQWRMILAARDLSDGGVSVKQLAERYRYGSEAAFAKAFRKIFGTPPAAFRRGQHGSSKSSENQEIH
jgi:AraC-like DNA-binding protein